MQSRRDKTERVLKILDSWPEIDRGKKIPTSEFIERRKKTWAAINGPPYNADVGFVFSDEHYSGDVPYLFGNTNAAIEQVAGGVGPDDLNKSGIIAGFEGVYVAGQLAGHGGTVVYPTESLQLADEIYPVEGFSLREILDRIAGKPVQRIALLTPRQVLPAGVLDNLEAIVDGPQNVIDAQEAYQRIKNLKSDNEMSLLRDASTGTALMVRAMLAVLEPGMLETEVAAYGDFVGKLWGMERYGFPTMVGSDEACVTLIGPCLNRPIQQGTFVHLGASGKRDGLTACCRRSIVATGDPDTGGKGDCPLFRPGQTDDVSGLLARPGRGGVSRRLRRLPGHRRRRQAGQAPGAGAGRLLQLPHGRRAPPGRRAPWPGS